MLILNFFKLFLDVQSFLNKNHITIFYSIFIKKNKNLVTSNFVVLKLLKTFNESLKER